MKRYLNISFIYAFLAMLAGVFYRDFTKWNDYLGPTALSNVHSHLFLLGMFMFLLVAIFARNTSLTEGKIFKNFIITYNLGLALTIAMMIFRGILQVLKITFSYLINSLISISAGLGHILVGLGIILFLLSLKKEFLETTTNKPSKLLVRKRTLLAIAGGVWIIAGINVLKTGILAYLSTSHVSILNLLLSTLVSVAFGMLFYKMSLKHFNRIKSYNDDRKYFWYFFDLKSYIIMTLMMSLGILLRVSGWVSINFISVFYTGLGISLLMAGLFFIYMFIRYEDIKIT